MSAEIEQALASSDWEARERGVRAACAWLTDGGEAHTDVEARARVVERLDAMSQAERKWEVLYALAKGLGQCHLGLSPSLDRIVTRLCRHSHGRVRRQAETTRASWQQQARREAHQTEEASGVEARMRALRRAEPELAAEVDALVQERFRLATVAATHDLKHRVGMLDAVFKALLENTKGIGARASLWEPQETLWTQHYELTLQIVRDMQTWAAEAQPTLERQNVRALVNLATQEVKTLLVPIALDVRVGTDLWVLADRGLLVRVLTNVFKNACEALQQSGREDGEGSVCVAAELSGREVEITVEDDGPGILPSTLERVFDPGTSSKKGLGRRITNTGYGLANARKFVAACGGSIGIESQPGAGTTVTILLPRPEEGA